MEYNASGMRTRKGDTYYELDGNNIISETTYGNTIRYYYGNGGIVGFRYNGRRFYYEKNLQGDIIAIYDENANKLCEYVYDAWGNCTIKNDVSDVRIGEVNPFRYRGYYYDSDVGLYYLKSRYYDPQVARFINADSLNYLGANGDLCAYHLFAYCSDNPVVLVDPNGSNTADNTDPGNFIRAIYVADLEWPSGLPVVGHTRMYLYSDKGQWYVTEFAPDEELFNICVTVKTCGTPPMYDKTSNTCNEMDDKVSVLLEGDFNASYKLALAYEKLGIFACYHIIYNNCSDYTDALLGVARINGGLTQLWAWADYGISIPVVRVVGAKVANKADGVLKRAWNWIKEKWNALWE